MTQELSGMNEKGMTTLRLWFDFARAYIIILYVSHKRQSLALIAYILGS